MRFLKSAILAFVLAGVALTTTAMASGTPPGKPYATIGDVNCSAVLGDTGCASAPDITVNAVTLGAATMLAHYHWSDGAASACATVDGTIFFRPTGATVGCFILTGWGGGTPTVQTIAEAQALVASGVYQDAVVTSAQGAGSTFERVACGGAAPQPSCTPDNGTTFAITGDATHVLQRKFSGDLRLSWFSTLAEANTAVSTLGLPILFDPSSLTTLSANTTLNGQWIAAGGAFDPGTYTLTFSKPPKLWSFGQAFVDTYAGSISMPTGVSLSPYNFGAGGAGVADDTAAWTKAVDTAANAFSTGGIDQRDPLNINGVFRLTASTSFPTTNLSWELDGCGKRLCGFVADYATGGAALGWLNTGPTTINMHDLFVNATATRTNGTSGPGIEISPGQSGGQVTIARVTVQSQSGDALILTDLDNCHVSDVWGVGNKGDGLVLGTDTPTAVGGIGCVFTTDRFQHNDGRCVSVGNLYTAYVWQSLECLSNNLGNTTHSEFKCLYSCTNFVFREPDVESKLADGSYSTHGLYLTGGGIAVKNMSCNATSATGTACIYGASMYGADIENPYMGSLPAQYSVETDSGSYGNRINLKAGGAYSISNIKAATNWVGYENIQKPIYHAVTFGATITLDLTNDGVPGNYEWTTGCNSAVTIANPSAFPSTNIRFTFRIDSSSTSCAPTFGTDWKLNGTVGSPTAASSTWIGQFITDGTNIRQVGLGYWQ